MKIALAKKGIIVLLPARKRKSDNFYAGYRYGLKMFTFCNEFCNGSCLSNLKEVILLDMKLKSQECKYIFDMSKKIHHKNFCYETYCLLKLFKKYIK